VLHSIKEVLGNLPTTIDKIHTHVLTHGLMDPNSLIQALVPDNGGWSNSEEPTQSLKSEFSTEETAAVEDLQEQKFSLEANSVVQFKMELKTENGTLSTAQDQLVATLSRSLMVRTLT
jgi:hypothetical protein